MQSSRSITPPRISCSGILSSSFETAPSTPQAPRANRAAEGTSFPSLSPLPSRPEDIADSCPLNQSRHTSPDLCLLFPRLPPPSPSSVNVRSIFVQARMNLLSVRSRALPHCDFLPFFSQLQRSNHSCWWLPPQVLGDTRSAFLGKMLVARTSLSRFSLRIRISSLSPLN